MRIALFYNVPSGGAKRALYEWTRRLVGEHTLDVYSLSTANHSFYDIRPFTHIHKIYNFVPRKLYKSPYGRFNQLKRWRDLGDLDLLNNQIAVEINAGGYDILFANTCMFTFIPALLQYIQIPSVYYLHEPFGPGFVRHFQRPYIHEYYWKKILDRYDPLIKLYFHRLETIQQKSIVKTGLLLANSHFTQERIRASFGAESSVCPYGVDFNRFKPEPWLKKERYVVSVGEMSPRKGFDFIIEGLGKIPAKHRPSLKLACNIVDTQEKSFIECLASRYNVDLQILTQLDTDELKFLYNQAKLCVYTPVLEPFGLVPLEAMACGTPVVGIREGGVQESVVHEYNGLLVERDTQQFATVIQQLLLNPELAKRYGRNGRDYILQNWTWDQSLSRLISYLEICAGIRAKADLYC